MASRKIAPRFVEAGPKGRLVILKMEDFELLTDALDARAARSILADESDPILDWDDVGGDVVSNRIASERNRLGLTQKELASRLGVEPSTMSRWEREDANLTLATLRRIARVLACPVRNLVG
ncbi:MAG: helix-turn-helix transcriptional regulator [Deltaproteobacteria bacterium]|nr:helix-turn-helix transcriptional regulator [Deltaproteobacteria bacterium]